jgi:predicted porin
MKKTQVALAALALVASAAAMADGINIYGTIDAGLMMSKSANEAALDGDGVVTASDVKVSRNSLESGLISPNFLGFKGAEDLGGGLKADFHLQTAYNAVSGGGFAFTQSDLGLAMDGVGTVRIGRTVDPMWAQGIAQFDAAGGANIGSAVSPAIDMGLTSVFPKNTVTYLSPNFNGLTVNLQSRMGGKPASNADDAYLNKLGDGYSGTALYSAGAMTVGAGVSENKAMSFADTEDTTDNTSGTATRTRGLFVGAGYDLGVAKVNVLFMEAKLKDMSDNSVIGKQDTLGVNGVVPFGATRLVAGYYTTKSKDDAGVKNGKGTMFHLTGFYDLSKRTSVFANYQSVKNSDDTVFPMGLNTGSAVRTLTNGTASAITVGVRHSF